MVLLIQYVFASPSKPDLKRCLMLLHFLKSVQMMIHSSPAKAEWDSAEDGFNIGPPNVKRVYCEGTAYSFLPSLNPPQFLKALLDNMLVEEGRQSFRKPYEHPPVISMGDEVVQEINS
ncbi:hypothetical protein OIU79_028818 [Salix purpurea]|uniref:Uncharacterized protein n=1 Tax=Salix purpurea TaxID=77065 RepID=A0A9Q0VWX9_SALPP|nr:hypothetical protein OIU79_028818 [Salix purpurea]